MRSSISLLALSAASVSAYVPRGTMSAQTSRRCALARPPWLAQAVPPYAALATLPPPRSPPVRAGLFDNLLGGGPLGDEEERGKFVRHADLQPGCAPLAVLCAGFDEEQLEAIAECVEGVWRGPDGEALAQVPIAVLSQEDFGRGVRLRDVLAQVIQRDSEIPLRPAAPRFPLILLSGFSAVQTSATVRAIGSLGLRGGAPPGTRPMFAAAVPKSLDKTLRALCDEIEGDHLGRTQRAQ